MNEPERNRAISPIVPDTTDADFTEANEVVGDGIRDFPAWHFAMLNDHARNLRIQSAIRELRVKGKTVFEIGSGAGLTAMMFAREGAARVVTCEMNPQLYDLAKRVFAANGMTDRITILPGSSRDVVRGRLLPFRPDIIFTETLDCGVVGEGFYSIREDIAALSGPNTLVMPDRVLQFGYIVDSTALWEMNTVGTICGFSMQDVNRYRTRTYFPVRAAFYRPRFLSSQAVIRQLRYDGGREARGFRASEEIAPDAGRKAAPAVFEMEATADGPCHGVLSCFDAQFGRYAVSNGLNTRNHWHQAFHPLPEPHPVSEGERLRFEMDDTGAVRLLSVETPI